MMHAHPLRQTVFALLTLILVLGCDQPSQTDSERTLGDAGASFDMTLSDIIDLGVVPDQTVMSTRLNSIFPNRGSVDGGVSVRLVGADFVDGVRVRIGRIGCGQVEVMSENHLRCIVPEVDTPGPRDVTVTWPDETEETLSEGFEYFVPIELIRLEPPRAPASGGNTVVVRGRGLVEGSEVLFDGAVTRVESVAEDGRSALVVVPPGEPGTIDVTLRNLNGADTLEDGFSWYEDLLVDDIAPSFGSVSGGEPVRLAGVGLSAQSTVVFGLRNAEVGESAFERRSLTVTTPAADAPGPVGVTVENGSGQWVMPGAFLYLADEDGAFDVHGFSPLRLPTDGGEILRVGGNGFDAATQVFIDGLEVQCAVIRTQLLECRPGPHSEGPATVTVVQGDARHEWIDGLTFYAPVEVFDIHPQRGSIAGGTLVEIIGRGFHEEIEFTFEDRPLEVVQIVDSQTVLARTPAHRPGWISLRAESDLDVSILPMAFDYFDPTAQFGGAWGEPIDGAINITVIDGMTGQALPGARVVVQNIGRAGRWVAETNALGQVTVSNAELELPVSATASLAEYTTTTFERLTVENATIIMLPLVPPMGDGEMEPIEPVTLSGRIVGLNDVAKPNQEGYVLVAFVERTHSTPENRLGASPPLPNGLLVEDGPFEIVVEPGEFALVVTAGYVPAVMKAGYESGQVPFWTFRDALFPVRMGLHRFITGVPGDTIDQLEVSLDRPMDLTTEVVLGNPSGGVRGAPDGFNVNPILVLGADGYFDFRVLQAGETPRFEVSGLPDLTEWPEMDATMRWEGEAETTDPADLYRYAWAVTTLRDMTQGVRIGPFVGNVDIIEPRHNGQMNAFRWVEWRGLPGVEGPMQPTEPADLHLARVVTRQSILWSHWIPGAANRFQYPQLPINDEGQDLPSGPLQLSIYSLLIDGPFRFDDFTYDDLSRIRALSFSYVNFSH